MLLGDILKVYRCPVCGHILHRMRQKESHESNLPCPVEVMRCWRGMSSTVGPTLMVEVLSLVDGPGWSLNMAKITRLDIAEALVAPRAPDRSPFVKGDVVACLAYLADDTLEGGTPLILRMKHSAHAIIVPVIKAGTTRDEVKQFLMAQVDSLFDTLEGSNPPPKA